MKRLVQSERRVEEGNAEELCQSVRQALDMQFRAHESGELIERNPESLVAWVEVVRDLRSEGFLTRVHPEFFERAFHPLHLMEVSERNPQAALAWLQLAQEFGGEGFLKRFE